MAMNAALAGGLTGLANLVPDYAGMGLNYLGTGLLTGNWGGTSKERKNQIHDIRTLRRREYQDMVHSLTQAGLNPILALGASPGHASARQVAALGAYNQPNITGQGVGSAIAANRAAGVAEGKLPSDIRKNLSSSALMQDQAQNLQLGRAGLIQQYEMNQIEMNRLMQDTKTGAALQAKYAQDAITSGYSAKKLAEETSQIERFGLPGQTWQGMLRSGLADDRVGTSAKDNDRISQAWQWLKKTSQKGPTVDYGDY